MRRSFSLLLIIIIVTSYSANGQFWRRNSKIKTPSIDPSYIEKLPYNLSLGFTVKDDFHKMEIISKSNDNTLSFQPAVPVDIGLKANYRWIGFSIGLTHINKDPTVYGKSKRFDLTLNLYGRWMITDFIVRRYTGFYASNPYYVDRLTNTDIAFPQYRSLRHTFVNFNSMYIFNSEKYSVKAAFTQNEIQLKSSGSPLLGYYMAYHKLASDEAPIPTEYQDKFPSANRFNQITNMIIGFQVGYGHTFIIKRNINFSFLVNPTFGFQTFSFRNTQKKDNYFGVEGVFKFNYRASLGYDMDWYYFGLMFQNDTDDIAKRKSSQSEYYQIRSGFLKAYVGFRFYNIELFE